MSREKIVRVIDEIENIKANLSFIFFADKAIHNLITDGNYHLSDLELVGMDNIKDLVLEQISSLSDKVIDIKKAINE